MAPDTKRDRPQHKKGPTPTIVIKNNYSKILDKYAKRWYYIRYIKKKEEPKLEENSKEKTSKLKKIKQIMSQQVVLNLIYITFITIYFIFFNIIEKYIKPDVFFIYIKASSFAFLILTILIFEKAYKEDNDTIALNGIEFLVIAIFTLLILYIPRVLEIENTTYILFGLCSFIAYYIVKNTLIYTRERKEELDKLSDIKEIVKDEPIKKETKRKNKPEE